MVIGSLQIHIWSLAYNLTYRLTAFQVAETPHIPSP